MGFELQLKHGGPRVDHWANEPTESCYLKCYVIIQNYTFTNCRSEVSEITVTSELGPREIEAWEQVRQLDIHKVFPHTNSKTAGFGQASKINCTLFNRL